LAFIPNRHGFNQVNKFASIILIRIAIIERIFLLAPSAASLLSGASPAMSAALLPELDVNICCYRADSGAQYWTFISMIIFALVCSTACRLPEANIIDNHC